MDSVVRSNKGRLLNKYKSLDGFNVKIKCILVIKVYVYLGLVYCME